MVLLEFSMAPSTKGESMSPYVARSLDVIDKSGLPYQLTPMGTIIEGDWDEVMAVVTKCFELMKTDCDRIGTHIKIDYRAGPAGRMTSRSRRWKTSLDASFAHDRVDGACAYWI